MKSSTSEKVIPDSHTNYNHELSVSKQQVSTNDSEMLDDSSRRLTLLDVDLALCTLNINSTSFRQQTMSFNDETTAMVLKQEYDCCHLLRSDISSRLILPLARRGRSTFSARSHRLLCSNCTKIKQQQQIEMFKNQHKPTSHSNHLCQVTVNFDLSSEEQMALTNHQYDTIQTLIWNINTSDGHVINLSYDVDLLNDNEKKILLDETIKKLQILLRNQSTTIAEHTPETISSLLQTTINILSSSQESI